MNKKDAEKVMKSLNNCSLMIYYGATPKGVDPINARISISQANISFDEWGFCVRDKKNEGTEIFIKYIRLVDIISFVSCKKIITYKYKTMEIHIEF